MPVTPFLVYFARTPSPRMEQEQLRAEARALLTLSPPDWHRLHVGLCTLEAGLTGKRPGVALPPGFEASPRDAHFFAELKVHLRQALDAPRLDPAQCRRVRKRLEATVVARSLDNRIRAREERGSETFYEAATVGTDLLDAYRALGNDSSFLLDRPLSFRAAHRAEVKAAAALTHFFVGDRSLTDQVQLEDELHAAVDQLRIASVAASRAWPQIEAEIAGLVDLDGGRLSRMDGELLRVGRQLCTAALSLTDVPSWPSLRDRHAPIVLERLRSAINAFVETAQEDRIQAREELCAQMNELYGLLVDTSPGQPPQSPEPTSWGARLRELLKRATTR